MNDMVNASKTLKTPSPEVCYAQMFKTDPDIASDGGVLFRWDGQIWRPIDPIDSEREAFMWLGQHPDYCSRASPKLAASCATAATMCARRLPSPPSDAGFIVLPLKNGYLHVSDDGSIRLESPEKSLGLTYLLECEFVPGAPAPNFMRFLESVLPDQEVREWLQAYIGYTLMPDTRFQRASFWVGSGANGKSTLSQIVAALHARTASLTIDRLDDFRLTPLIGASLVLVDETPARIDEQVIKTLISGGLVQINRKFRDPISIRPCAKWIICGNSLPAVSDHSVGFWRRLAIVNFERRFAEHEQDPLLADRIIKHELSGVFSWALAGLVNTIVAGRLPALPTAMLCAVEAGRRETSSTAAWAADDRIVHDAEAWTSRADVYLDYKSWATERGFSPVNEAKFWRQLRVIMPDVCEEQIRKVSGKTVRGACARLLSPNPKL